MLDSPELRALGRAAAQEVGAEADGGPVAYYAKDERGSTAFLVVDGAGARHAADFVLDRPNPQGVRGELWAELIAISQEEA